MQQRSSSAGDDGAEERGTGRALALALGGADEITVPRRRRAASGRPGRAGRAGLAGLAGRAGRSRPGRGALWLYSNGCRCVVKCLLHHWRGQRELFKAVSSDTSGGPPAARQALR